MSAKHAFCSQQTVVLGRSTDAPQEWVIASAEVRPHLDPQVAWVAEASEFEPLLRSAALRDAEQLLIACHGSSDGLALGGGLSTAALKTQVSQQRQSYPLPQTTPVQLWACHAGGAEGPAAVLQEALGNPVLASTTTLGRGKGLVGIKESATTKVLQELPIALHTNSVGFDIVDNLNGTFGLVVYYGTYHANSSELIAREGGLALFTHTLALGSSSDFNAYTSKAYGAGGEISNVIYPFQNPPHSTDSILFPLSLYGVSAGLKEDVPGGNGKHELTEIGFRPGFNYFFVKSSFLVNNNTVDYSDATNAHQSAQIPAIVPGTYRAFYDGQGAWDNVSPPAGSVGSLTNNFTPYAPISQALITITGSGDLIFGDAPKVLIDSVDLDNGYSPTDFITSTRTVKISGSYAETSGVEPADIKVTFNGETYDTSNNELTAANGSWTLDFGDQQFEQKSYTIDVIKGSEDSTKVSQELDIVNVSVQSIDRDDGEDPNDFITSDQSLIIEGLYDADRFEALEIGITNNNSGAEIVAGRGPSSTLGDVWTLDLTDQVLTEGTYSINVTATDEKGATYNNSQPLKIVDIPQPLVVTAVGGNTSLLATSNSAQISGTYDPSDFTDGNTIGQLTINGIGYRTNSEIKLNNGSGTWTLNPNTLPYGALDIRSEIDSSQHYNTADYQITIVDENSKDATDPNPPVITQIANNDGNFVSASGSSITTQAFDLELKGTYRPEDAQVSLTVEFDGSTYKLGSDKQLTAIGNEWTFKLPNAKSGSLTVQNTNLYNRSTSTSSVITIDVPAPAAPTIETLASTNGEVLITPGDLASATNTKLVLTGGYESLRSVGGLELTYEGETYVLGEDPELSNFGDTWTFELENPTSDLGGSAVQVKATSASGKSSTADASVALELPEPTKPELIDVDGANVTNLTLSDDFKEVDYLVDGDTLIITGSFDPDNAAGGLAVSFVAQPKNGEITGSTPATIYTLDDPQLTVDPDDSNQWILSIPSQSGVLKSATVINGNGIEAIALFGTKILELDIKEFDYSQSGGDSGSVDEDSGLAVRGTPTNNYPNQLLFNEDSNSYFLFATSSKQDNWLKGEEGNDEMLSNGGADTLQGGAGRDQFTVSEETAEVDGGDGADRFKHQGAAFSLHTLDMGSGRDRLVNTGMLLMAENNNGLERVLQMGAGNDQLTTNTYIDVDVLDGGSGNDKLLLTDASESDPDLIDQKSGDFKTHDNNKGQGFEITGFESIRQDAGTWNYQGDFKSSDLVIAGGIANFELNEPVSVLRAKRVRFNAEGDDAAILHFDVSQLLEDDLTAKEPIRFRIGRLAKAKELNLQEMNLTLSASETAPSIAPEPGIGKRSYVRWDLNDPKAAASESMMAESHEGHSMAAMSAIEDEPDQSIYLGRVGKNLILTTTDIFS